MTISTNEINQVANSIETIIKVSPVIIIIFVVIFILIIRAIFEIQKNSRDLKNKNEELQKQLTVANNQINYLCRYVEQLAKRQNIIIPPPKDDNK